MRERRGRVGFARNLGVYRVDTVLRLEVDDQETRRDLTRDVRRVPLAAWGESAWDFESSESESGNSNYAMIPAPLSHYTIC